MEKIKIYIDRLKHGDTERIKEVIPPQALEVAEQCLEFREPLQVAGEIYLADEHLVCHLKIKTAAFIPCSICNETVRIAIDINDLYISKPLVEIKKSVYDLFEDIREAILIHTPQFTECNGNCPERKTLQPFLQKVPKEPKKDDAPITHFPFADLN